VKAGGKQRHLFTFSRVHGVVSQKAELFITTAVRISNPTIYINRRFPTAAARVRAQVRSCVICGGQSGTVAGFLRVLRFPPPILIPPTAPHSSSSISTVAGTVGQIVADVPSGLSPTPPQETKKKSAIYI
jgi:hypothetical protein